MPWSEWHRISEMKTNPAENLAENEKTGVYQVRATTEDRQPLLIHRACGDDLDGTLYIGQGFLPGRIGYLMNICNENAKFHHDLTWVFKRYALNRIADRRFIEIRWMPCEKPRAEEQRLMDGYKMRTGDLPPGNRKLEGTPPDESVVVES